MPGLNKTGPLGNGPMTGRKMGRCTNFQKAAENDPENATKSENIQNEFQGRGLGMRRGFGNRGRGDGFGRRFNK
ncbi:MAG: DUF5320 domain-containing protein [Bacteroidota bacterium]